jgi:DNA-binding transcriptional MerR regulator
MSDIPSSSWVTVAEAAERAGVDSGTVRQWYRSGKLPTRRADGGHGAFLVPLAGVLELAPETRPENGAAPALATNEVLQQVDFLRKQLAELSEENRALRQRLHEEEERHADLRARLADTEDELAQLRTVAARSSITDSSWLEQRTPAYESPVRPQGLGASAARVLPKSGELADLLAATRPDGEEDDVAFVPSPREDDLGPIGQGASVGPHTLADADEGGPFVPPRPASSDPVAYGTHEDDLLPEPDKPERSRRRGR